MRPLTDVPLNNYEQMLVFTRLVFLQKSLPIFYDVGIGAVRTLPICFLWVNLDEVLRLLLYLSIIHNFELLRG